MLERQFLMRLRARDHLLDLIQQLGKALPLVHLHTQHLEC